MNATLRRLKNISMLDLESIEYAHSNGMHDRTSRTLFMGILRSVPRILLALLRSLRERSPNTYQGQKPKIVILCFTKNQFDAVYPVFSHLQDYLVISGGSAPRHQASFQTHAAILKALPFFPVAVRRAMQSKGLARIGFAGAFERYWMAYGYVLESSAILDRLKPQLVIVSNDHSMTERAATYAAKLRGIKTLYVQHASVTESFPPLDFDVACLDGVDALEKYECAGPVRSRVFLTGSPKADRLVRLRSSVDRISKSVGICPSLLDDLSQVVAWTNRLRAELPTHTFHLRAHPRDQRTWRESVDSSVQVSLGKTEDSASFLERVETIVAGPSNILLEATLAGVRAISVSFGNEALVDHYGFVESGLVPHVATPAECIDEILKDQSDTDGMSVAKKYCATLHTEYEGRSAELVAMIAQRFAAVEDSWSHQVIHPIQSFSRDVPGR